MKLILSASILSLVLWFSSPLVLAHGDEDHGAAPATVEAGGAPRVVTHSDLFELVGIVDDGAMTLYLDRFADNSPVTDAKIEVEVGSEKGVATANPNGTYSFPAKAFAQPSEMPITFTITAGSDTDLLAGDLAVVDAHTEETATTSVLKSKWVIGGLIVLIILIVGSLLVRNRRQKIIGTFK